jgi:hypothetical protein
VAEAKAKISPDNVKSNVCLSFNDVLEALDILRGAVSIVYPMGLPEYDPIRCQPEKLINIFLSFAWDRFYGSISA